MQDRPLKHPQALVTEGEASAHVDRERAPLIQELWRAGTAANASCEEHDHCGSAAYLNGRHERHPMEWVTTGSISRS
jgi:hypothetical protein